MESLERLKNTLTRGYFENKMNIKPLIVILSLILLTISLSSIYNLGHQDGYVVGMKSQRQLSELGDPVKHPAPKGKLKYLIDEEPLSYIRNSLPKEFR